MGLVDGSGGFGGLEVRWEADGTGKGQGRGTGISIFGGRAGEGGEQDRSRLVERGRDLVMEGPRGKP